MNTQKINYVKDTFPEYLGKKDHISASDIKTFVKSPKLYYYKKYEEANKTEPERHLSIGSAIHEMILEPHQFNENFIVFPKIDKRTKEGKAKYDEFVAESQGKTILYEDEMDLVVKASYESSKNETLVELIRDSYRELSCYTTDEKTGLKIKVRPDIICKTKSTIVDIKSCLDSSYNKFKYANVEAYQYYISAAFYMDFLNRENYVFCAVEKQAPYQTSLYCLDDDFIERGRATYRLGLDLLKWSYDNSYFPDYTEFAILKECYELDNLENFFEIRKNSEKITIMR
jgi:exodeoxyribonuclease VIII